MPPSHAVIPSPQWENHWKTAKTLKGFENTDGVSCYRNAILQMLFHLPVFLNWVHLYINAHCDGEGDCPKGKESGAIEDEDTRCKLCLLSDLIDAFWDPTSDEQDFGIAVEDFWEVVFQDWLDGQPQGGSNPNGPQDVLEFVSEILHQLGEDLSGPLLDSLNDIFSIHSFDKKACTGHKSCGNTSSSPDAFESLTVQFPEDQDSQTLEQAIKEPFAKEPMDEMCTSCKANPLEAKLVLTKVPEVLLVHLDRIGERDTASGEVERFKINSQIDFPEEVVIKKEWLDPALGDIRKDIKYVLSSVILHQSETTDGGHFMAVVKSQDETWTFTDDAHLRTYESFGEMAGTRIIRETAYIFAYRRLPLVTRGPEITLMTSLQDAKYSDPEAAETYDPMDIDQQTSAKTHSSMDIDEQTSAKTHSSMDIDQQTSAKTHSSINIDPIETMPVNVFGPNRVPATLFEPRPKLPTAVQQNGPRVIQQYDETEIELDEKQRGTLEVKFTTNTGVTTLKVHVKGMLWNELKDSRPRASAGRRPVTRSVAASRQASDVVPPKPVKIVKINPKAGILEKKPFSELVKEKKRQSRLVG